MVDGRSGCAATRLYKAFLMRLLVIYSVGFTLRRGRGTAADDGSTVRRGGGVSGIDDRERVAEV